MHEESKDDSFIFTIDHIKGYLSVKKIKHFFLDIYTFTVKNQILIFNLVSWCFLYNIFLAGIDTGALTMMWAMTDEKSSG